MWNVWKTRKEGEKEIYVRVKLPTVFFLTYLQMQFPEQQMPLWSREYLRIIIPGGLQSMGLQRVRHNWVTSLHFTSLHTSLPTYTSGFILYLEICLSFPHSLLCITGHITLTKKGKFLMRAASLQHKCTMWMRCETQPSIFGDRAASLNHQIIPNLTSQTEVKFEVQPKHMKSVSTWQDSST